MINIGLLVVNLQYCCKASQTTCSDFSTRCQAKLSLQNCKLYRELSTRMSYLVWRRIHGQLTVKQGWLILVNYDQIE